MRKEFIFLVLLLFVISLVHSISFTQYIDNNIIIKEYPKPITFNLSIDDIPPSNYNFYTTSDFYLEPSDFFIVSEKTDLFFNLKATPMNRVLNHNGSYVLSYSLNDRENDKKYNQKIILEIMSISDITKVYSDLINLNSTELNLNIENQNNLEIKNLRASFKSILFDIEADFDLSPLSTHSLKVPISNEELRKIGGGSYIIEVVFFTPNSNISTQGFLYINEKKDVIYDQKDKGFFIKTTNISVFNTGNTYEDARIEIRKNILHRLFTSFSEEPIFSYREGNDYIFVWNKRLAPAKGYTISAKTANFMPFIVIILVIILIFGIKRFLRTKIVVLKTVSQINTKNNEFALRVRIILKAKANVQDISLVDKIPGFVKVYKKSMTLPDEIDAATRRFKWNISDMNAGEERHFSYIVYSRVGYVGKFVLPSSICYFKYKDEVVQVKSNSVFYVSEKKDE
jgi:hypothetical protein